MSLKLLFSKISVRLAENLWTLEYKVEKAVVTYLSCRNISEPECLKPET